MHELSTDTMLDLIRLVSIRSTHVAARGPTFYFIMSKETPCHIDGNPVMPVIDSCATLSILTKKIRKESNLSWPSQDVLLQEAL
jgi:hypothetical protein